MPTASSEYCALVTIMKRDDGHVTTNEYDLSEGDIRIINEILSNRRIKCEHAANRRSVEQQRSELQDARLFDVCRS
ncbi:hypothetical protein [Dipodfec virus UOA04_Rod_1021]|nr:hypothetical protein [Dipodfec virus UOA04_Rod_1021]